jgi:hypothetical protein
MPFTKSTFEVEQVVNTVAPASRAICEAMIEGVSDSRAIR